MVTINKNANSLGYNALWFFIGLLVIAAIIFIKSRAYWGNFWTKDNPIYIYTFLITTFQLSRIIGAIFYRPMMLNLSKKFPGYKGKDWPLVSFVIPCKNEGVAISKTVTMCFAAKYPKSKLEVIVINDGSTDNTGAELEKLKRKYPRLTVVNWAVNRGKRHGMAEGFLRAKGEIVIQLDSDSYISPETVKNIIKPFSNPEIGAVCAHADPENADKNWLTKMQAAYYFMSFRILKAAESTFAIVFCCSGCSSAYRKGVVLPIIHTWLNETFLKLPVTWGDDRALTNWVIKIGYKTIYTDQVKALTICPDTINKFLKQQIRWKKGWFVNSIFATKFILKREPFVAITYFFPLILLTLLTPFMAVRALIYYPLFYHAGPGYYLLGMFLVAALMTVYYRLVARENKYWPYMFAWSSINTVFLSFILFYSLATIQNRKWGTR